jgi:ATP-dependent helicase/nuclease subunit B
LLEQWLAYEGERMPGRAIAVEQTAGLTLGGLQFDLRIDRINAIGRHGKVVIDYKTGDTNPQSMLGPRPREPQLAMYALALDGTQAVLCAQVVENACRIMGWKSPAPDLADASPLRTPPVDVAAHWQGLLDVWRVDLTRLADEYRRGFAAVAPRDVDACRECDLQPVCRIRARRQFAADA